MKNILCIIPARQGSKGLPGKNTRLLNEKPLIAYSIEAALTILPPENICVSTDSEEAITIAESLGLRVPFVRPSELAGDKAGTYEVILHALDNFNAQAKFDYILLLQPTSPFRTKKHLEDVLELMVQNPDAEMIVSVKESKENPYFNLYEEDQTGHLTKSKSGYYTRRQECPKVFAFNGSIYLMQVEALKHRKIPELSPIVKYLMPEEYSIDIDTARDWMMAEFTLNQIEQ